MIWNVFCFTCFVSIETKLLKLVSGLSSNRMDLSGSFFSCVWKPPRRTRLSLSLVSTVGTECGLTVTVIGVKGVTVGAAVTCRLDSTSSRSSSLSTVSNEMDDGFLMKESLPSSCCFYFFKEMILYLKGPFWLSPLMRRSSWSWKARRSSTFVPGADERNFSISSEENLSTLDCVSCTFQESSR